MTQKRERVRNAKTTGKLRELIMEAMHNEKLSTGQLLILGAAKDVLEWQLNFPETRSSRWLHNVLDGMKNPFDFEAEPFISEPESENSNQANVLKFSRFEEEDDGA